MGGALSRRLHNDGSSPSEVCQRNLDIMLKICTSLGVPTAPAKCAGPASSIVFLGVELDTEAMEVRLPRPKLERTQSLVQSWLAKRACRKNELESLLGHLQHAATVIRPGRTFVRRLIKLLAEVLSGEH